MSTPTMANPMAISYATICAAERIAPRNAYLEFAAQPARMMPYTPIEVSARMYSRPASMLANACSGRNGITAQMRKRRNQGEERRQAEQKSIRVRRNHDLLEYQLDHVRERLTPDPGIQQTSRRDSGRWRVCIQPMTLRSARV